MNPITSMLAGAKLASTALPMILSAGGNVVGHLPDIKAKFGDLVAKLEKAEADASHLDVNSAAADVGAAWKDGMAIYDDVGLPRSLVGDVVATAAKDNTTPAFVQSAIGIGESLAKQFGLAI